MKSSEAKEKEKMVQSPQKIYNTKKKPRGEAFTELIWPSLYRITDRQEETRHKWYCSAPCIAWIWNLALLKRYRWHYKVNICLS